MYPLGVLCYWAMLFLFFFVFASYVCALEGPTFNKSTAPVNSVVVFAKGEGGYYCHKIPYLLVTASNTLIAFAEARGKDGRASCDDFSVRILN